MGGYMHAWRGCMEGMCACTEGMHGGAVCMHGENVCMHGGVHGGDICMHGGGASRGCVHARRRCIPIASRCGDKQELPTGQLPLQRIQLQSRPCHRSEREENLAKGLPPPPRAGGEDPPRSGARAGPGGAGRGAGMVLGVAQHSTHPAWHGTNPAWRGERRDKRKQGGRTDGRTALLHAATGMEPVVTHQDQAPSHSRGANPTPDPSPSISFHPERELRVLSTPQDEPAVPQPLSCPFSPLPSAPERLAGAIELK